jgi:hypothetical protein
MTDSKLRDRNRSSWTNLRHYELSYRHGNDALPQTRYFQCESPESAFDAFVEAFHGNTEDLVIVYMTVENPYSHIPEEVDVHEILTQNPKYTGILVDNAQLS